MLLKSYTSSQWRCALFIEQWSSSSYSGMLCLQQKVSIQSFYWCFGSQSRRLYKALFFAFDGWSNVKKKEKKERRGNKTPQHRRYIFSLQFCIPMIWNCFPPQCVDLCYLFTRWASSIWGENLFLHHLAVRLCDSRDMKNVLLWESNL